MEVLKFTKKVLNLIGVYDFENTNKILTVIRNVIISIGLLLTSVSCFAFCIANMKEIKKILFPLYATFGVTVSLILYSVLMWKKMDIRSLIVDIQEIVNKSE